MSTVTRQNAQLHCRTCLRPLVGLAYDMEESPELINWLERLLPLVSLFRGEDQLDHPHLVCLECYAKLNEFNEFHDMVCRTTDILDSVFNENKIYVAAGVHSAGETEADELDVVNTLSNGDASTFKIEFLSNSEGDESTDTCSETEVPAQQSDNQQVEQQQQQIVEQKVNGSGAGSFAVPQKVRILSCKVQQNNHVNNEEDDGGGGNGVSADGNNTTIEYVMPLQTVINRKSYKCSKCERKFLDKYSCIMHIRSCQLLGHQDECFECEICHKNYQKIGHLNRHKRMEHEDLCPLKCEYAGCNFIFRRDTFRQRHYEMFHVNELKKPADSNHDQLPAAAAASTATVTTNATHDDDEDDESTKAVAALQNLDESGKTADSTNAVAANETADESEQLEDGDTEEAATDEDNNYEDDDDEDADDGILMVSKPYRGNCTICHEEFKLGKDLRTHINTVHSDKLKYSCTLCTDKRFLCQANLSAHMTAAHTEKNTPCQHCDKVFRTDAELKKHISRVHHGIRPYACRFCVAKFGVRASRDRHERATHTGEKPYACDICERTFSYAHSAKKHKRSHEKGRLKDAI